MKATSLLIIGLLALAACAQTAPEPTPEPTAPVVPAHLTACAPEQRGAQVCTLEYAPVCGETADGEQTTFGNICQACADESIIGYQQGACPEPEPVRPADFVACEDGDRLREFCTKEYRPVCGETDNEIRCITEPCPSTTWVTYPNACDACKDGAVAGYRPGTCSDLGLDLLGPGEQCPEGYDEYASQLGRKCVKTADNALVQSWPQCLRQTQCTGDTICAYAMKTTDGEDVEYRSLVIDGFPRGSLRCVPEDYFNYLLHTTGVTSVDANGERSTMIA